VQADPPIKVADLFTRRKWIVGATAAYRAELVKTFPKFSSDVKNEDEVFALCALLRGKIANVSTEPLVNYRVGVGVSAENYRPYNPHIFRRVNLREAKARFHLIRQWCRDLEYAGRSGGWENDRPCVTTAYRLSFCWR